MLSGIVEYAIRAHFDLNIQAIVGFSVFFLSGKGSLSLLVAELRQFEFVFS